MSEAAQVPALQQGRTVRFRPRGNSMRPRIESGALCTVAPLAASDEIQIGDVVLCRVHGRIFFHLVTAIHQGRYRIGNNHGHTNGWTTRAHVYGRLVRVEP